MIKCEDICKSYFSGDVETVVLHGLNFKIDKGEFVAIIGPSGSGKSTFMHLLGCLDVPTEGEYYIDGTNVAHATRDELAGIRNKKIGF